MTASLLAGTAALAPSPSKPDLDAALRIAQVFKYNPAEAMGLRRPPVGLPPELAEACRAFSWSPAEAAAAMAVSPVVPGVLGAWVGPVVWWPRPPVAVVLLPPPPQPYPPGLPPAPPFFPRTRE